MRKTLFLSVLLVLLSLMVGCGSEKEFNFSDGKLIVGMEAAYAPFNWTENEKTETNHPLFGTNRYVEGYDVQIAKLVAEQLGLELVIKQIAFDSLVQALKTGMIDAVIAGMSPTENRKKSISFTEQYYESTHVVVMKKNSPFKDATKFSDFKDARIVGQRATLYDGLAKQLAQKGNGVYQAGLDTISLIVNAMNVGMTDVTVLEEPVAKSIVALHSDYTYIHLSTPFDIAEEDKIVSIGVRKKDELLREKLNAALATISAEKRNEIMDLAVSRGEAEE